MTDLISRFRDLPARDELVAGGRVNAALWLAGTVTLVPITFLPGIPSAHRTVLLVLAGIVLVAGVLAAAVDWTHARAWWFNCSSLLAIAVISMTVSASGGATSPTWIYFFLVAVYASYFYAPSVAIAFLVLCALAVGIPLLYDDRATHGQFLAQWLLAVSVLAVLGGAIILGKRMTRLHQARAEMLAAEQGALRRVATAVVRDESPERVYAQAVAEAAALLGADAAGLMRSTAPGEVTVVASSSNDRVGPLPVGRTLSILPGGPFERAVNQGPTRAETLPAGSIPLALGHVETIAAPVMAHNAVWGVMALGAATAGRFGDSDLRQLVSFCELVGAAITSLEDRAALAFQALTDPLTELANQRVLRDRLAEEVARALRHQRPLSVAMLDIDNLKQINDSGGHDVGDQALIAVATCLRELSRTGDTIGRRGGDEFMWILPDTAHDEARTAVERVMKMIAADPNRAVPTTLSGGIADTTDSTSADELMHLADVALYRSKTAGRNKVNAYADGDAVGLTSG